jgi:cytochrome c oxidase subunit 4
MNQGPELRHAWRRNAFVWIALLALLTLTTGSAFFQLGALNSAINLAIAALKTLLVVIFFMHWGESRPLTRLVVPVALALAAVLFGLSSTDYQTRDVNGPPASAQQSAPSGSYQ